MPRILSDTFTIGDIRVDALSDGAPDRPMGGFFNGAAQDDWMRAVGITDPDTPLPFNFGAFLVRGLGQVILVDSGAGASARQLNVAGGGELLARLADVGVERTDVNLIVHTHLHSDHCGWDIDQDADGGRAFPRARIMVSRVELEDWTSEAANSNALAPRTRAVIDPLIASDAITTFDGEHTVNRGITMISTPGHTPGHSSVLLSSSGEHAIILGDVAHHPAQLEDHEWLSGIELDPANSIASRKKVCDLAADRNAIIAGGHFPVETRGRVSRTEQGYVWRMP